MVEGALVSQPYVRMTLAVMSAFGVDVPTNDDLTHFRLPAGVKYRGRAYDIEPDASAASYFFGRRRHHRRRSDGRRPIAREPAGRRRVCRRAGTDGLPGGSAAAQESPSRAARLHGIDVDMNAISDTVQTLGRGGPVRRRADDDPRRRPHPAQRNRPHRRPGHGAAQARRHGRRARRRALTSRPARSAARRSTPITTTAWR